MKTVYKIVSFTVGFFLTSGISLSASSILPVSEKPDSIKLLEQYSLFSEYFKNKDYLSALPYGWNVLSMDPVKFNKWIYYKMEDAYWYLHDSSDISEEQLQAINDTILIFYDKALEYYPDGRSHFLPRKAFVAETWLNLPADTIIAMYEAAIEADPEIDSYYYHRLGQLYKNNISEENDYKMKALDLYSFLSEREPNNSNWPGELESLVDSIDELVDIARKTWDLDKENLAKAWKYASLAIKAERFPEAIEALEFLITKAPETANYWNQLATVYQKTGETDKSIEAYKKLTELEPDKKEHYLNLGIAYKDKGQYSTARQYYRKANDVAGGWGLAVFYEGLLYEQSARSCEFNFETKLVYLLAVNTYRRALNIDPSLTQAQERISALHSSVPTQEDYFFRGYKSGNSIPITGNCFGWIGGSVTVP